MSISKEKKLQREAAIKKAKRNKLIVTVVCIVAAVGLIGGVITFFVIQQNRRNSAETYSYSGQTIWLHTDGKFEASLSHDTKKSGTYTKSNEEDGSVKVIFKSGNNSNVGWIIEGALHLPSEWDDGHSHGSIFPRIR
ncbi:MAG: hypothetical protein FWG83_00180 [Oscillospiraceae bacterium]|nr:hypothetical protein [Oscillospiraceae bacterium]